MGILGGHFVRTLQVVSNFIHKRRFGEHLVEALSEIKCITYQLVASVMGSVVFALEPDQEVLVWRQSRGVCG